MDYHKMLKIFGSGKTQIDWRLQMAAGFRQFGGKINGIDSVQNKKVETRRKQIYGNRKPHSATMHAATPNCRGKSGYVVATPNYSYKYFDSCEVIDIKYYWGACVAGMAAVGKWLAKDPRVELAAYIVSIGCGLVVGDFDKQASKSDIGAVYIQTYKQEAYMPYSGGVRYYVQYSLLPQ